MFKGVYVDASAADTQALRLQALKLVVKESSIVVDGTATWFFAGDRALAPGEHRELLPPRVFDDRRGCRMRRRGVDSGTRDMRDEDVIEIDGLRVTTALRTATDVARLQRPQRALASLDSLLAAGAVDQQELIETLERFRGFRHVVRARSLVRWADGRSESYGESAVRYVWRMIPGLPTPQLQVEVRVGGHVFRLDLADEDLKLAFEYDGREFHGPDRAEHDMWRRGLVAGEDWAVNVLRDENVFGRQANVEGVLSRAFRERRRERRGV
ncbi:hypothetical protein KLP28_08925 [Nocardioidaceae bacterium]|nr:hypothetical protein KLP28_08925 [Nocardioidaceae bacterium]